MPYNKNTFSVTSRGKQEFVFHLTDRPSHVEVQIYKFGDPKRKETIGYYNKSTKWFERTSRNGEWEIPAHMISSIFAKETGTKSLYFTTLNIKSLSKQTILKNIFVEQEDK